MKDDLRLHLNEVMEEQNYLPRSLAQATGFSLKSIYNWKKGDYKIYLSNLLRLCDVLECSIEYLIGRANVALDYMPKQCPPFYDRLREVMKEKGITRYRVAKETKLHDSYFTIWKKGREPQLDTLIQLANYIGCSLDYLVGRDR